jgi:serine/threonine-protein kinase
MPMQCRACKATIPDDHEGTCPACGIDDASRTAVMAVPASVTVDIATPRQAKPPGDPLIGNRIAGCLVMDVLGAGGMGKVYSAVHQGLSKAVAVKVLNAQLVANATFVERFLREARAAAQLDHPNVVRILNAGEDGGRHFIVMEMVEGENLRDRLRREGRLGRPEAIRIATGVAHALAAAHELDLVHRDIKPDNIMLSEDGAVKVADFGLARQVAGGGDITGEGFACGTPPYMSPEQISGHAVDGRSDLYSLGIVLYECLSGRRPFQAQDVLGWLECHTRLEPEDRKSVV